jgi:solute carrier family 35 protein F5
MVGMSDSSVEIKIPIGAVLALVSSFFYASYLVFLRRMVENEEKMEIPMFFGNICLLFTAVFPYLP